MVGVWGVLALVLVALTLRPHLVPSFTVLPPHLLALPTLFSTMPTTQAVTDSPPAPPRSPRKKAPLKRSSSTASLPTPPPTYHKRKRSRSRGSVYDTDSDASDCEQEVEEKVPRSGAVVIGRKKRRTGVDDLAAALAKSSAERAAEEDAFWLSDARGEEPSKHGTVLESPPALLTQPGRVKVKAPISPPPSRRKPRSPRKAAISVIATTEVPVTPPRRSTRNKGKEKVPGPIRDSPNNPFLTDDTATDSLQSSPIGPRTPKVHVEKPTLTYVL
jgi:hypothetical protein